MLRTKKEMGDILRKGREDSRPHVTQECAAAIIRCSHTQIKNLEKGENCSLDYYCKYAEVLGLNPIEVLFEPEDVTEYYAPRHCDKEIAELWNSLNIDISTKLLVKDILKQIYERRNKKK